MKGKRIAWTSKDGHQTVVAGTVLMDLGDRLQVQQKGKAPEVITKTQVRADVRVPSGSWTQNALARSASTWRGRSRGRVRR